jgi:hypothetical protein
VLKGNPKLRIIITLNEDANFDTTCTVEDIFDYQRLEQFPIFKQVA